MKSRLRAGLSPPTKFRVCALNVPFYYITIIPRCKEKYQLFSTLLASGAAPRGGVEHLTEERELQGIALVHEAVAGVVAEAHFGPDLRGDLDLSAVAEVDQVAQLQVVHGGVLVAELILIGEERRADVREVLQQGDAQVLQQGEEEPQLGAADVMDRLPLSQAQKEAAGSLPVYELTLTVNGSPLADWAGGKVKLTIPFTAGSSSAQPGAWMLGSEGEKTQLTSTWDQEAKTLSFETQQAARFLVGQQEQEPAPTPEAEPETPEPEKKAGIGLPAILGGAAAILILAGLGMFWWKKVRSREE